MIFSKIGSLPFHQYIWVDSSFVYKESKGWIEGMLIGLTSIPGRSWGFNVILQQGGALYRQIPPHAIAFSSSPESSWSLDQSCLWNCYSLDFTILHNPILEGMKMTAKIGSSLYEGQYLWSTTFLNDGWSRTPEQDKEFFFMRLDNGRLTIQPTNRITFKDSSYIDNSFIPSLKLNEIIYSCSESLEIPNSQDSMGD
jgi:hypothetical protein